MRCAVIFACAPCLSSPSRSSRSPRALHTTPSLSLRPMGLPVQLSRGLLLVILAASLSPLQAKLGKEDSEDDPYAYSCPIAAGTTVRRSANFSFGSQDGCMTPNEPASCPVGTIGVLPDNCDSSYIIPPGHCIINWPDTNPCGSKPGKGCDSGCLVWFYEPSEFEVALAASKRLNGGERRSSGDFLLFVLVATIVFVLLARFIKTICLVRRLLKVKHGRVIKTNARPTEEVQTRVRRASI